MLRHISINEDAETRGHIIDLLKAHSLEWTRTRAILFTVGPPEFITSTFSMASMATSQLLKLYEQ